MSQNQPYDLTNVECRGRLSNLPRVAIVSYARTPIGGFGGGLSGFSAPDLGAIAIKGALEKIKLDPHLVDEVVYGNVLSANVGQAPAKQAALKAGISTSSPCTTVNKVCASGMKATMFGAQLIQTGTADIVVVGGMESMSNCPYYLPKARTGYRMGNGEIVDGMLKDGLTSPYDDTLMGIAAEKCSVDNSISKKEQDEYALNSYRRSKQATESGLFNSEIVPVVVPGAKGKPSVTITKDEEVYNPNFEKLPNLQSAFKKDGTGCVTAGNSSTISDGASALVLMSEERAKQLSIPIIAFIRGMADAAQEPNLFPTTPALAIPRALDNAGLSPSDIDFYEINEAFSVVALANMKKLDIPLSKCNVFGGAVSMGHPIGSSGSRIICTLISVLKHNNSKIGVASICNGGGGASAIVIELN
eukprot:gene4204-5264_t